jgi:glycerate 2-kinase
VSPSAHHVLAAPTSFKGTLRATEVAAALERGFEAAGLRVDLCPIADGGDGTMEVLLTALGGETGGAEVVGPLGDPVSAGFGLIEDGSGAIVEVAQASGFALVPERERGPEAAWSASSRGTGELVLAAIDAGAEVVFVGAGGSAMTDGGLGAIEAIGEGGGLRGAQLVVLCDARIAWEESPAMFSPQKGADPATVRRLERRLRDLAGRLPRDPRGVPLSGAAGGLAGGLWAAFDAKLEQGSRFVLDALGFDARMRDARAVIVGEGCIDDQTLHGKAPGEAATRCRQAGVPCHAIVGRNALDPFDARILDLQTVTEAGTIAELEQAASDLGERIAAGNA